VAPRGEALLANRFFQPRLKICAIDWVSCSQQRRALQWQFCRISLVLIDLCELMHCAMILCTAAATKFSLETRDEIQH
jgi:hypothetical protein